MPGPGYFGNYGCRLQFGIPFYSNSGGHQTQVTQQNAEWSFSFLGTDEGPANLLTLKAYLLGYLIDIFNKLIMASVFALSNPDTIMIGVGEYFIKYDSNLPAS